MRTMVMVSAILAAVAASSGASAQQSAPPPRMEEPRAIPDPYAAYEFLIGNWVARPGGGQDMAIRQLLHWGPKRSYITYSTYNAEGGKPEQLHFEGIMVWNGRTKALDYVFAVEPGSGVQEKGVVRAQADGSVVREVEFTGPTGQVNHFRQTFRRTGPDTIVTALMRQTPSGWVPTFPGSDALVMARTPI